LVLDQNNAEQVPDHGMAVVPAVAVVDWVLEQALQGHL
jgi:hypothetical protein